jgi:DNA-directed RNA polymerase subunit RPC12/RpoP
MGIGQERCDDYPGFECPVCGHRRFYRVLVPRDGQTPYRTAFYGCVGCSIMFTDPYRFTQSVKKPAGNFGSASYERGGRG